MSARRIFWLLLILALAAAYHYRQTGLDVAHLSYKFTRLYFKKNLITKLNIHGTLVYIYTEPVNDKPLQLVNPEQLQPILKKAYNDYFAIIENRYPEMLEDYPGTIQAYPKKEILNIVLVAPETYESFSQIRGKESSGYIGFLNTIYLKTYGANYQIKAMIPTIRHEIFHYLNNYYGVTAGFEEVAAKRFGSLN